MQQNSASSAFLPLLKRKYEVTTPSETTKRIKFTITSSTSSEAPLPSLDRTTSGSTISSPKSFASSPALTAYSHSPMMKGNSFNKNFLRDSGFNPSPELTPLDESETTDLYTDGTELLARQAIRTAFQSNSLSPYEVKLVLGWGGNGCILAGTRRADHKPIAIKIIYKRGKPAITPIIDLPSEITVLKQLKHKNIISLLDWFEDKNAYFIGIDKLI